MYLNEKLPCMWHGCDYNPDQWSEYPEILEKDLELMKQSGCNVMSVGIFAWSKLEPREGEFEFAWLDRIIDTMYQNGIYTILATPSGAMPSWLAETYPEVKRMSEDGIRNRFGNRHNHCYSSPIYREKVRIINQKLAARYAAHPAVLMWHISNEYNVGDCHCPLCRENFRTWLREKYQTIEHLNRTWWNGFWSHNYADFSQIDPPGEHGESSSNPLKLEWQRFKNHMLYTFLQEEVAAVRSVLPHLPVTANFMRFMEVDYEKLSECVDFVSWDNYPEWHMTENEFLPAAETAMYHSIFNSLKKDRPFMMMESSPSATNWQNVSKLRRPGMHMLASMQAVAHGSDTVQYFQWRKSRGQSEQFHGAVVGHDNSANTRVFSEVSEVGDRLAKLSEIVGSHTENEVAILFDYENVWALEIAQAYRNTDFQKGFSEILLQNYGALWQLNIGCDFVFPSDDFSAYRVIVVPMLFLMRRSVRDKLKAFVRDGGTLIATFINGVVDEDALSYFDTEYCPLREVLGVRIEETDSLPDGAKNTVELFGKQYRAEKYCELASLEGAEVLGTYCEDFYRGMPAVTAHSYGKGRAYYVAANLEQDGLQALYHKLLGDVLSAEKQISSPENLSITMRYTDEACYVFLMNFNAEPKRVELPFSYEVQSGDFADRTVAPYGCVILKRKL